MKKQINVDFETEWSFVYWKLQTLLVFEGFNWKIWLKRLKKEFTRILFYDVEIDKQQSIPQNDVNQKLLKSFRKTLVELLIFLKYDVPRNLLQRNIFYF